MHFEHNNLKALINNTKSEIWSLDLNYKLISFNHAFSKHYRTVLGKDPQIGDDFLQYAQKSDHSERFKLYLNRVKNRESFTVTEHIYEPQETWKEVSFNPIEDDKSEIIGVACFATDISERKLFERNLIQNQNRLKRAQEIAHLGNWELNLLTNSAKWSDESYKIYGITSPNFDHTFESWLSFIHPEDLQQVKEVIRKGYENMEDYSVYHRIIRPDGSIRYLYSETHFEFDNTGKPIGVYGIAQDLTDRRSNEIKLQELLKKSNEHNKWLSNFTHIVSHNIKSHNGNIIGIVDLLETSESNEEFEQLLNMLKQSTTKLNETVNNLAEYISFQNNTEHYYKKVNLKVEIDKTCQALSHVISESKAAIENKVDSEVEIHAIPSFIESILLNLLSNALKYRSSQHLPLIQFYTEAVNGFVKLVVKDNGLGIDLNKHKNELFGMYQTFHGNKDALGFGLFITKNQIEAMNGKIEIQSEVGQGSTFSIYFNEKN